MPNDEVVTRTQTVNNKDSVKYEIALPQIHHQPVAADATFKNATSVSAASAATAASTNIINNSPPPPPPRAVKKMVHLNDGVGGDNNVNVGNVVKPTPAGMNSNQFASLQRFSSQGLPGGHHHHHHHHYYAYHPVNIGGVTDKYVLGHYSRVSFAFIGFPLLKRDSNPGTSRQPTIFRLSIAVLS